MDFLIDTNVLSELWKPSPALAVLTWLESAQWMIPSVVIAEIQEGAESSKNAARRLEINARLDDFLAEFSTLTLAWDFQTARIWGQLRHSPEVKRKPQSLWDSLIDAMAVRHGMQIATRNVRDFRHAKIFDPWTGETFSPRDPEESQ